MQKKKNSEPTPCPPSECVTCLAKETSPLCSVTEAQQQVRESRSEVRFKAGQTIFYQGNDPLGLFIVQEGVVKLQSVSPSGDSNTLRLVGPGQALGYRSLFSHEPYQASAICVEDTLLCFLNKHLLKNIVSDHPVIALNLLEQLPKDLRTAEEKWITQVNKGAPQRVAEALIFLDDHFKDQPWTRREIGQWAGTTPETVMRSLAQFEKEGLISSEGRAYRILDREKLFSKTEG